MQQGTISRATLGRLPAYLRFLKSLPPEVRDISATSVAKGLGFGEIKVRKDLGSVCSFGRPKVGYTKSELIKSLEGLIINNGGKAVIVGAGKLGRALLDYKGFADYGLTVLAAFDKKAAVQERTGTDKFILPTQALPEFCKNNDIRLGIIAVPSEAAQEACELLYESGVRAIMCFAQCHLNTPPDAVIQYENVALSLAFLNMRTGEV